MIKKKPGLYYVYKIIKNDKYPMLITAKYVILLFLIEQNTFFYMIIHKLTIGSKYIDVHVPQ